MADNKKKILVVDDERSIVIYLTTVLEDNGYEASSVLDPEEALSSARKVRPDLICLDVMMPKRSGIALYQDFRKDRALSRVPVIFISAFNHIRDLRDPEAFRKMIPDRSIEQPECCLEKPIKIPELLETIKRLVGGSP